MDFNQSETKKNLMRAFAGESQARNRYTIAAGQAKKEGLDAIAAIFLYTAEQEKEHAEIFYKHLTECAGETIEIDGTYPIDIANTTAELLQMAKHNEYEEHDDVYQAFGNKAYEEGFKKIAASFFLIADIEKTHGDRFRYFAELLEQGKLYESEETTYWLCLNCGHIHKGTSVPPKCPVCDHEQGYFIPLTLSPYEPIEKEKYQI
ncbi:rubrerythrin [Hominifimenecus sp. rT4P-3]|uniref:rubrerythrin n=1 Tax=Hominifimenecus sp. rT4P-3 TaxID=3242979 RepID=UPI003DA62D62